MGNHPNKKIGYLILLLFICGLLGTMIGDWLGNNFNSLTIFKNYVFVGMQKPLILNLKMISVTFAIGFNVNVLSLVGMMFAFILYKKM